MSHVHPMKLQRWHWIHSAKYPLQEGELSEKKGRMSLSLSIVENIPPQRMFISQYIGII